MSKQEVVKVQEIEIPCMMAEDGHLITGKTAYKGPGWSEENPTANLLCVPCSEVVLDDRTGLQVKTADIRAMVAAMVAADDKVEDAMVSAMMDEAPEVASAAADGTVVVEEIVAEAPAQPRICPICDEPIPPEHEYPKHHRCHIAADLVARSVKGLEEAKWRITQAEDFLGEERKKLIAKLVRKKIVSEDEILAFEHAQSFMKKAYAAMAKMDYLKAVQLAWLAKDAVAERYVVIMSEWLADQVDELRNDGFLGDGHQGILPQTIEEYLVDIEYEMGKGRYLPAYDLLNGNHEKASPGAFYQVGYVRQRFYTGKLVEAMQTKLTAIRMIDESYEMPDDLKRSYQQAERLYHSNPWKCWDVAESVKRALERIHEQLGIEAEQAEVDAFLESRTLRARAFANAVPEDVEELEELLGGNGGGRRNHKKVQSERGDGDGRPKRNKKQEKKFRGGRSAANRRAIEESALTALEPTPA